MIDQRLVIVGTVRNGSQILDKVFENIKLVSSLFKETKCVIVESDSDDNTIDILKKIYTDYKFEAYSLGDLEFKIPYRTGRISKARNFYLDIVEEKYKNYDLMLVLDFNQTCIEKFSEESILSNFKTNIYWDMVCANQALLYYDLWALRHPVWMPHDCWAMYRNRPSFMSAEEAHKMFIKSKFININKEHPWIKVDSAFGGSAFIKIPSIQGARHSGLDHQHFETCEWVSFCKNLNRGNSSIYINPKFINQHTVNSHTV